MKKQASFKSQKLLTSIKTEENIMENLESDIILKDKSSILVYIKKYYQKLYKREEADEDYQEWFLDFVTKVLTEEEQRILTVDITQKEIFKIITEMNSNRAPGIDGIPIEFYVK